MWTFLSIVIMILTINLQFTKGIEWTVDQKVFTYGQNLILFCNIGNCCFYTAGWDRWNSKELIPIYIDVRNLKDDSSDKYGGKANKSGFFLTIRDLKEVDLDTEYSCSYDFNVSKKKILQKTEAFKDLEWIVDQKVSSYGHDLTLFCNVGTCCEYQFRWSKWKSGSHLSPQYINEDMDIYDKYNEKVNKSGFFLTIRNFGEDDLNKEYSCVYNNRPGKRKHLLKSDAFYISEESSVTPIQRLEKKEENESSGQNMLIPILIGVAVLVFLMTSVVFVYVLQQIFRPPLVKQPVCITYGAQHPINRANSATERVMETNLHATIDLEEEKRKKERADEEEKRKKEMYKPDYMLVPLSKTRCLLLDYSNAGDVKQQLHSPVTNHPEFYNMSCDVQTPLLAELQATCSGNKEAN